MVGSSAQNVDSLDQSPDKITGPDSQNDKTSDQKLEKMVGSSAALNIELLNQYSDKITDTCSQHDKTSQKLEKIVGSPSVLNIEPLNQYSDKITDTNSQHDKISDQKLEKMVGSSAALDVQPLNKYSDKDTDTDSQHDNTSEKLEKMVGSSSALNIEPLNQYSDKITDTDSQHDKTSHKLEKMVGSSSALNIESLNQYSDKITVTDSQHDKTSQKLEKMVGSSSALNIEPLNQYSDKIIDTDSQHVENVADDQQIPVENIEDAPAEGTSNQNPLTKLTVALMNMVKDKSNELKINTSQVHDPEPISMRGPDQDALVLDATPISAWRSPEEAAVEVDTHESSRPQKKKKTPSHLLGDMNASFEVINGLHADNIDLNELIMASLGEEYAKNVKELQKFSFSRRLKGWKFECRARISGKCDLYYYHGEAGKTFRSVKEVVNFMLFEAYPGGNFTLKEFFKLGDGGASTSSGGSARRKKSKSNIPLNQEAPPVPETDSVKFLKEANDNLLKFFDK